jgi:heme/copper-type cytochrome/quinol oxidase subunit 2
LLWVLFSALYLSFNTADNKGRDKLFLSILRNSFSITFLVEFLANIYTFSLIIELIVITLIIFLSMLIAFTETTADKEKYVQVNKLLNGINTYIGLNILLFLLIEVIKNWGSLLTVDSLKSFMLPIIFTIMFIPYLFYLIIRISYDDINIYLNLNNKASRFVKMYFKI